MVKSLLLIFAVLISVSCANRRVARNTEGNAENVLSIVSADQWELAWLRSVSVSDSLQSAFIDFDTDNKKISGNAGCNTFSGNLQMTGGKGIVISDVIATKMACEDMSTEHGLFRVFKETRGLVLMNDTLILCGDDNEVLAKFLK